MPKSNLNIIIYIVLLTAPSFVMAQKPNFILFIVDDQMHSELGYTGGDVHTPNIDALAKGGLIFTNAYTSSTVCSPARYSSLTGRYAGRNTSEAFLNKFPKGDLTRIENVNTEMEDDGMNLQTALKSAGYTTGFVGKWHLGFTPNMTKESLNLATYSQTVDPKNNSEVNNQMKSNHEKLCAAMRDFGWDYAGSIYEANLRELHNEHLNVNNIDWTVMGALEFMDQAGDKPFFLYFSTTLNHGPHPGRMVNGKMTFGVDADPGYTGEGYMSPPPNVLPARNNIKNRVAAAGKPANTAFATWLDDAVGALQNKLVEQDKDQNTLMIYLSDHGKDRYGKSTLFYGGVHIPMFASWKGKIIPNSRTDEFVQNIDIAATFYDFAGVDLPVGYPLDGVSMRPYIEGNMDAEIHPSLFFEIGYARAVMTKEYKYIAVRYPEDVQAQIDRGEKFDGWQGEQLDYPYLLNNSHLGFYSSAQNPHYFHMDQIYDVQNDLLNENNNLLYNNNGNPIGENNLSADVKQVRDEMQDILTSYLKQFPERPFGEFYDGTPMSINNERLNINSHGITSGRVVYAGMAYFMRESNNKTITLYDYSGRSYNINKSK